jgi:chromosome segregation ATPase
VAEKQSKPAAPEQSIEELQKRYQKLHTKKIQAETQRDGAKSRLDELKQQARDKYGTDDLALLRKKLDEIVADNAQKRATYQADLDKIEKALAEVDAKFAGDSGAVQR